MKLIRNESEEGAKERQEKATTLIRTRAMMFRRRMKSQMERKRRLNKKISFEHCVAPGALQSDKSGIPEFFLNEDDKAAREESEHEDAVCTQKRVCEEADICEASR